MSNENNEKTIYSSFRNWTQSSVTRLTVITLLALASIGVVLFEPNAALAQTRELSGDIQRQKGFAPLSPDKLLLESSSTGATMTSDNGYLYVLRGNTLFKISEATLTVQKSAQLSADQAKVKKPASTKSPHRRRRKAVKRPNDDD